MRELLLAGAATGLALAAGCVGANDGGYGGNRQGTADVGAGAGTSSSVAGSGGAGVDAGHADAGPDGGGPVTPAQLMALLNTCTQLAGTTKFAPAPGKPSTIPICTLKGALWWSSGMSIACDGGKATPCTSAPGYSPSTAGTDSMGHPLDASTLPFIVVPLPSNGLVYATAGIALGDVAAVLYKNQLVYAIFGDQSAKGILGEGSYALASALGIDPNPVTGGVSSGVTYILFTGAGAKVAKPEDHAEAVSLGAQLAAALIANN
jgi:hypothetical protein